jgi:hypothetical protein
MFPLLARDGSVEAGAGFRWLMPSVLVAIFRPRQRAARLDEIPRMSAQRPGPAESAAGRLDSPLTGETGQHARALPAS